MTERITILPVKSLADAEREIEKLARRLEKVLAQPVADPTAPPTGPAGGVLSGGYPNPGFAVDMATQAELDAAIAGIPPVDLSPYRTSAAEDVINAAEAATRAADDATETAARTAGDAAVQAFAIQRANHTGSQLAATISDFNAAVRAQVEAALAAGASITITPSGSGATRILTIASTGGGATLPNIDLLAFWPSSSSTVTASESFSSTPPHHAIIRGISNNAGYITNGSALPQWIQVQLPTAVIAKSYAVMPWYVDNYPGRAPKSWTFAGSNDGSTFTTLDTQTNFTTWPFSTSRVTFSFTNTTAYAYYRWTWTANQGNAYTGVGGLWIYGQPS